MGKIKAPIIVIVGQTASGKSALAMRAARQFGGEIICADSRTIYKGMDIGTAKPSVADRRLVVHHGLDLIEPSERFSAAAFQAYARERVADIQSRHKLPVMVGGTGLYIDGYVYNFSFPGYPEPVLRAKLETLNLEDLQNKARRLGIDETQQDFQNQKHLIRAIERIRERDNVPSNYAKMRPSRNLKSKDTLLLGIQVEREQLLERIAARVDTMFAAGLVNEVQNLINRYGRDAPGLLAPAYKEVASYLEHRISLDEAKELTVRGHKSLAKRQQTWFKRDRNIIWVQSEAEAMEYIGSFTQV